MRANSRPAMFLAAVQKVGARAADAARCPRSESATRVTPRLSEHQSWCPERLVPHRAQVAHVWDPPSWPLPGVGGAEKRLRVHSGSTPFLAIVVFRVLAICLLDGPAREAVDRSHKRRFIACPPNWKEQGDDGQNSHGRHPRGCHETDTKGHVTLAYHFSQGGSR